MARLHFWFEFASTYSYLSAMRVEELARARSIDVEWHPFLLGPIFNAQGWQTSPFNIYEAKGRYMWRDMERLAADRGLAFRRPDPFPQNGLHAARLALLGRDEGWTPAFTRAVYEAEFAEGANISEPEVLARCLEAAGRDAKVEMERIGDQAVKDALKAETGEAQRLGLFGAPSFVAGSELFWGDDRLEQALDFAVSSDQA